MDGLKIMTKKIVENKHILIVIILGLSLILGSVSNVAKNEWSLILNHVYELIIVWSVYYWIVLRTDYNSGIKVRLSTVFFIIALATIVVGFGWSSWEGLDRSRVQLIFGNPNILSALLVIFAIGILSIEHQKFFVLMFIVTILSLINTGSRTSMFVFIVMFFVWLVNSKMSAKRFLITLGVLFFVVGGINLATKKYIKTIDTMINNQNILYDSNDFLSNYWTQYRLSKSLKIIPKNTTGPYNDTRADHIIGKSGVNTRIIIYQNAGFAENNMPYIASIYLRSDAPQQIVLNSNLASSICNVTRTWHRCETPVGRGNSRTGIQLRLETIEVNSVMDLYAWGAQLEIGEVVSQPVVKYKIPSNYYLFKRYDISKYINGNDINRWKAIRIAWGNFLTHPVFGVGKGRVLYDSTGDSLVKNLNHSHNLFVELLASEGLIGFLAWLIPFVGFLLILRGFLDYRVMLLVFAMLLLNVTDVVYYAGGVYSVYWLLLGLLIAENISKRQIKV